MVMTFRRKKRSSRKMPLFTRMFRSLFVAAITLTSTFLVRLAPTMQTSLSWRTRRSFVCIARLVSLISSRKIVPPSAV
jgi:hypothetical protein